MWKLSPVLVQLNSQKMLEDMQRSTQNWRLKLVHNTNLHWISVHYPKLYRNRMSKHIITIEIQMPKEAC